MLGPIQPVGAGPAGDISSMALRASRPTDIPRADSTRGAVQAPQSQSSASSTAPLQEILTQLFETLGLDAENNKALEMLIALLILLAVLESLQNGSNEREGLAGGQSAPGGDGSIMFNAYASSTTITIEQSTTMIAFGEFSGEAAFGDAQAPQSGGRLDISA